MNRQGKCKLCLCDKELQLSHAIPNTYFRHIFSKSDGNAICFADDLESEIGYSNDSGKELQLCRDCEAKIEQQYEGYAYRLFKGESKTKTSGVSYYPVDACRLTMFFASIIWRAANSNQDMYNKVCLSSNLNEALRYSIFNNEVIEQNLLEVRCSILKDYTKKGGFTEEHLLQMIPSPFSRKNGAYQSVYLVFYGFFAEVRLGRFGYKESQEYGVLSRHKRSILFPYIDIFSIPELTEILLTGYKKSIEGKSKINYLTNS
jgi:hypothetical protein